MDLDPWAVAQAGGARMCGKMAYPRIPLDWDGSATEAKPNW